MERKPGVGPVHPISPARLLLLALAVAATALLIHAAVPESAAACQPDGPCVSPTYMIECPNASAGSSGAGSATFNIPKDATDITFEFKDSVTGTVYSSTNPICSGTTMSVSSSRTLGATQDTFKVDYTLTSDGTANPSESHSVQVTADWSRPSDIGVTKVLLGGDRALDDGEPVTFSVVIHNYGPAPSNGVGLADTFVTALGGGVRVTGVEQVKGPDVTDPPGLQVASMGVFGNWSKLAADDEIVLLVHAVVTGATDTGQVTNRAAAANLDPTHRVDPVETNNSTNVSVAVRPGPASKIRKASAKKLAGTAAPPAGGSGTRAAGKIDQVEVAVFRAGGAPLDGTLPEEPTNKKGECKWLFNPNGKFGSREANEGLCDSPIWLDAKGAESWKLKLKKPLPKGEYVVFSRAAAADGSTEWTFTKAAGNRKKLKLR